MAKKPKDPKRIAAGKKSRRKGAVNERVLAKLLRDWWGHGEWARTPLSGGWASKEAREGFRTCGDVITTAQDFPFCVEAKQSEEWRLEQFLISDNKLVLSWWRQVEDETPRGQLPLLIIGRNGVPHIVVFDLQKTIMLCSGAKEPWASFPYCIYDPVSLGTGKHPLLGLMALDRFLQISPDVFGRKVPHVEPAAAAGSSEAVG